MKKSLEILVATFDECIEFIREKFREHENALNNFEAIMKEVRLYDIQAPIVVLSANYGVPQNRERVLFIGCRNDQQLIAEIPYTVSEEEKVKVYEALWDMDMVGNGVAAKKYKKPHTIAEYEPVNPLRGPP